MNINMDIVEIFIAFLILSMQVATELKAITYIMCIMAVGPATYLGQLK